MFEACFRRVRTCLVIVRHLQMEQNGHEEIGKKLERQVQREKISKFKSKIASNSVVLKRDKMSLSLNHVPHILSAIPHDREQCFV